MGKVLIYAMLEGFGGVEEYALNLLRYSETGAQRYGYVILGGKTVYEDTLKRYGADFFFIPPKRELIKNIKSLWRLFRQLKGTYDTIYFNTSGLYYPVPYLFAKMQGYKIVLHSHSREVHDRREPIHNFNRWWIGNMASLKLACSTPAARWLFGKKSTEAILVPNAVDLARFAFDEEKRMQIRRQLGLEDAFVIGHVGRLTQVKNQTRLLDILAAAKKKRADVRLLLVGDGEDEAMLREKAQMLGISDDVVFYGSTRNTEIPMQAMDCFALPSLAEGFPVTLVEAQGAGLPCVASAAVTTEVNMTGDVTFLPLEESNETWAETILSQNVTRRNNRELLRARGFDAADLDENVWTLLHGGKANWKNFS